jgi:ankyrin repeat protein
MQTPDLSYAISTNDWKDAFLHFCDLLSRKGLSVLNDPTITVAIESLVASPDNYPIVASLLKLGATPNSADGWPNALATAICQKQYDYVKLLIQHGADVNSHDDLGGRTPLFEAIARNSLPLVKLLLASGADVNHADHKGDTALHKAVLSATRYAFNPTPIIEALLQAGANISAKDDLGRTPAELAASHPNTKFLVRELSRTLSREREPKRGLSI